MGFKPQVKFFKLTDNAKVPTRALESDAGFDLCSTKRVNIPAGNSVLISTGLAMAIPNGWCGQINPRSGIASKHKVTVGARVIDAGYRGEVMINLINHGHDEFEIYEGDRVAQILFLPVLTDIEEVDSLDELGSTERGGNGFGSTGIK